VGYLTRQILNRVSQNIKRQLAHTELTDAQWIPLFKLYSCKASTVAELARAFFTSYKGFLREATHSGTPRGIPGRECGSPNPQPKLRAWRQTGSVRHGTEAR
jgi:hypothetical protein